MEERPKAKSLERDYNTRIVKRRRHEGFPKNRKEIKNALDDKKLTLTISLLDIREYPISYTERLSNPILLVFKNGSFEILPSGINGAEIQNFIGVKFSRITYWSLLPVPSKHHPINPGNHLITYNDIYEY